MGEVTDRTRRAGTGTSNEASAVVVLPHGVEAAEVARKFVADQSDHLRPELVEDAQLLVSEIVANAVLYGRPDVVLRVRIDPPGIGVTVTDTGAALPTLSQRPDPAQPCGRGLLIVDALASAWGVVPEEPPPGKAVWFQLGSG